MKKSLIALGMCLLAFTQIAHAQSRLQEILGAGVLRVGTTGGLEPNDNEGSCNQQLPRL